MKKNKGFTLVELLAVIAILGIIMSITAVIVLNTIDNAEKNSNEIADDLVKKAADIYVSEHTYSITKAIEKNGNCVYIYIKSNDSLVDGLVDLGYLKNNSGVDDNRFIKLSLEDSEIKYTIVKTNPSCAKYKASQ